MKNLRYVKKILIIYFFLNEDSVLKFTRKEIGKENSPWEIIFVYCTFQFRDLP